MADANSSQTPTFWDTLKNATIGNFNQYILNPATKTFSDLYTKKLTTVQGKIENFGAKNAKTSAPQEVNPDNPAPVKKASMFSMENAGWLLPVLIFAVLFFVWKEKS
jgi:hypothetical protein